jgi:hypothetical protein
MIEHDRKELLKVINTIKEINTLTDEKCPITYNLICDLEQAEWILRKVGAFRKVDGHWSDYAYAEEVKDDTSEND